MRVSATSLVLLAALLAGCGRMHISVTPPPVPAPAEILTGWAAIAGPADRAAIAALPRTWTRALAVVPRSQAAKLKAEGALVDPAAALELPALPPGPYHCRMLRFGGRAGFAAFPPDICYVEVRDTVLSFDKQTGSNLPQGWLHPDTETRQVFLGALRLPGETTARAYGADPGLNVAGVVERVSPFRWRLTLTKAGRGAILDIYELVPVTPTVVGAAPAVPAP